MTRAATTASGAAAAEPATSGTYAAGGLLGNARTFRRDPLELLVAAHAECGDVARIPLAGSLALYSVRHPNAIHRVLVDNAENYIKGRSYTWFRRAVGVGMFTADGEESRWRRTSIGPAFGRAQLEARLALIVRAAERTRSDWEQNVGGTVDIGRDMADITMRVIGDLLFGVDLTAPEHRDLRDIFLEAPQTVRDLIGSLSQFVPQLPTPLNRALRRQRKVLDRELDAMIAGREAAGVEGRGDIVARMLRLRAGTERTSAPRTYRTPREMREEIITLLGAGHETTGTWLASTWIHLARHPDVEARVHAELDAVLGGRAPTADDLGRLTYLGQVLDESMRVTPPAWGILREAAGDDVVTGVPIPAGALVVISPYVTQHDPRWYPDPERFDPDRFDTAAAPARPRHAEITFGAGPRACIGKLLAEWEARVVMAMIAQRFRLRIPDGAEVEYVTSVTYQPRPGTLLRLEAR
jgi:cytochrome P450